MKSIRMWLNDGNGPRGRVLKSETVERVVKAALVPPQKVAMLPAMIQSLSNDVEFWSGLKRDGSYTFMINSE
ncbi:hypothetical protein [Antarctobacter sp.]|uniref:hypothetical protein n=1 Tax=Antarctobacter sp. TaxID=1872577 RepID=UPI002B2759AE|nr:hypothetical protein [Antarctobacter sp.]